MQKRDAERLERHDSKNEKKKRRLQSRTHTLMLRMQRSGHKNNVLNLKNDRKLFIEQIKQMIRLADYFARLVSTSCMGKGPTYITKPELKKAFCCQGQ